MNKRRGRKGTQISLVFVAGTVMLAACGGGGADTKKTAAAGTGTDKPMPKIYLYANVSAVPQPAQPAKMEELRNLYKEKVGVEPIVIVPPQGADESKQKLNLMLSSGENLDTFEGAWDDYASSGAILPLNDLLDKYGQDIKKAWSPEAWRLMTDKNGKIWGIPRAIAASNYYTWVRTDWLKKLNLQMPKTVDELELVLKAFKEQDPDGNGKDDTIPMITDLTGLRMAFAGAFLENGYSNWVDPKDNKVKPPELSPGYRDFVAKMADWYKKGYIYKEAFGKFDTLEMLKTGRIGASSLWYSRMTIMWEQQAKANFPGADYTYIPGFSGPKGLAQTVTPGNSTALLIAKSAKDPAATMKYINYQYQDMPANSLTARFGTGWKFTDDKKYEVELPNGQIDYNGEYWVSAGLSVESRYAIKDPLRARHSLFLAKELIDMKAGKQKIDAEIVYNKDDLKKNIPMMSDLQRLQDEEFVKFVMGARPLSDFDKFIEQLNNAGLNKWIDEYTRQYNELKK